MSETRSSRDSLRLTGSVTPPRSWRKTRCTCSGSNPISGPAGCGGRLAGQAPGLPLVVLLPHARSARSWPASVGKGLEVQVFGVGGVARESAVTWSRALERSLCYAYGCWEVLEKQRPRPIDLIVGRSTAWARPCSRRSTGPAAPVVNFLDYYYHAHRHDLADEAGPETPPAYFHWRRSMAAIDLLDLEQASLGWTPTHWQRELFPAEYRDEFLVLHDGVDTRRSPVRPGMPQARGPRSIAGRVIPE